MIANRDQSTFAFRFPDDATAQLGTRLMNELERGLAGLGFETVAEDSFGVLALRVVDRDHVGTAYVEFKDGGLQIRMVLLRDAHQQPLNGSASVGR